MATTYKTPGVYIEEISKFPPSIAQVETAIPAFIGYTEKAAKDVDDDLLDDPTRITSMLEYDRYFGGAQKEDKFSVNIVEDDEGDKNIIITEPAKADKSPFQMYYALQMYFANGGGPCYIISIKKYEDAGAGPIFSELAAGLQLLEKEDEPTLILFPDATSLNTATNYYNLYNLALDQCNKLQDRFSIIDTFSDDLNVEMNDPEGVRDKISSNAERKYGAVYFPYLKTILNYDLDETKINIKHIGGSSPAPIAEFKAQAAIDQLKSLEAQTAVLQTNLTDAVKAVGAAADDATALTLIPEAVIALDAIVRHMEEIIQQSENAVSAGRDAVDASEDTVLANDAVIATNKLDTKITTHLRDIVFKLQGNKDSLVAATTKAGVFDDQGNADPNDDTGAGADAIKNANALAVKTEILDLLDDEDTGTTDPKNEVILAIKAIVTAAGAEGTLNNKSLNEAENLDNEAYNAIKAELNKITVVLPPSSSMAGVYAKVDNERGVWKAPANVSLNFLIKPTVKITHEDQKDLNIHTTGKSINAIRTFTGKGTLVWGARTLAGNDNEWKYIPVRRFFNMVEESVKKATERFVFEPNDANTWIKVRAMIENFLTLQWRAGALAGAKPEQAYYVRVGLGETMTAQDILNGKMIVEIGMAAVRPAEFIILKFSHKMQEA